MNILYFIEYNKRVFAYRRISGKLIPVTRENYGRTHAIVEVPEMERETVKRDYPEVSYRTINDDRIPKYIKNKVKHFDGPFSYTSNDSSILNDEHDDIKSKLSVDDLAKNLINMKKDKMRKLIISKISESRDFIEGGNSWLLSNSVKDFHRGKIQVLKELLETTD